MHGGAYSSPHLVTIDGVSQVVILSAPGAVSVNPADGKLLWEHKWEGGAIVQPAITSDGDILINGMAATGGVGTRRLVIKHSGAEWTPEERWTSNGLKPYFNDLVVHKGHAFGFDGNILSCIDLADGKRKWKGGRYGNGQMLLLADQDLLLVLSEDGELALVSATPDQFKELARIPALNAKTWNHPVIVGNVLLIRNGEEMAAFRLPAATRRDHAQRSALRLELPDRPDFDAAFARRRNLRRDLHRFLLAGRVDQVEARELFLGFRERPVGNRDAAAADPNGLRGLDREQRLRRQQQALLLQVVAAIEAFAIGDGVQLVGFQVDKAEILHGAAVY